MLLCVHFLQAAHSTHIVHMHGIRKGQFIRLHPRLLTGVIPSREVSFMVCMRAQCVFTDSTDNVCVRRRYREAAQCEATACIIKIHCQGRF